MAMREASVMTQQASRQLSAGDLDRADLELAKAEERLEQQAARASTPAEKRQVERSAKKVRASRVGIRRAKAKPKAAQKEDSRRISLEANDAAMEDLGY
jgi:hypothetical protein